MRESIKRLAGETLLYGIGSMVPRMFNFFLVPLHTRIFGPEEYGTITNLFAYVGFINVIYIFGLETAFFRFATKPSADVKRIFNLAQTAVVIISISLSSLFLFSSGSIAQWVGVPGRQDLINWIVLIILADALVAIPFARLRIEKKATQFVLAKIINVALLVGFNVYFLLFIYSPETGIGYLFLANLLANGFYLLFFWKQLVSWKPAIDKNISAEMLSYSYPIMLTGLAGMTNEMFSRLSLEWWLPKNFYNGQAPGYALGIFGACYKFAVLMNLFVQAFRFAAEPFFFSNAQDKNSPAMFAKVNHLFIVAGCFFLIAVSLNMNLLKYFVDPAYWSGLEIVPILLMAYLFLGIYYNMSVWFKLTDKTYFGTVITTLGAALTILLNYLMIPHFGYLGSSWVALACYTSMAVLCYFFGQKYFPIPYQVGKAILYLGLSAGLVIFVPATLNLGGWMNAAMNIGITILTGVTFFFLEKKGLGQAGH